MTPIDDGRYDAIVIDARTNLDDLVQLTLTITRGDHKGMVIDVIAHDLRDDGLSMLGLPVTLDVVGGAPSLRRD